jgi:hypothetical protein
LERVHSRSGVSISAHKKHPLQFPGEGAFILS